QRDISCRRHFQILLGITVAQCQIAIGCQCQVTLQCCETPCAIDTEPLLGCDHVDLVGIHAAQFLDIDGEPGSRIASILCNGLQCAVENLVSASNDVQVFAPDFAFDDDT